MDPKMQFFHTKSMKGNISSYLRSHQLFDCQLGELGGVTKILLWYFWKFMLFPIPNKMIAP